MPEREEILRRVNKLSLFLTGRIAKDNEIWEGDEYGAHFKFTKEALFLSPKSPIVYSLSISGPGPAKIKIVSDFVKALGEADNTFTLAEVPGVYYAAWIRNKGV